MNIITGILISRSDKLFICLGDDAHLKFRYHEKATKIHPIFHFLVNITYKHQIISGRWYKFLSLSQNILTLTEN